MITTSFVRPTAEQATALSGVKVNNVAPSATGPGYVAHLNSRADALRFGAAVAAAFAADPDVPRALTGLEFLELWPGELAVRVSVSETRALPNA